MGKARKLKSLRRGLLKAVAVGQLSPEQADDVYRMAKGKPPKMEDERIRVR